MNKIRQSNKHSKAFTIVELLVVVVVIGVLAAITIVSYSGISNKATAASLRSDLSNDVKLLKMYNVEYGYYPSAIDGTTYCPTAPNPDTRYCLKASQGTTLAFTGGAQAFKVKVTKNGMMYYVTEGTEIAPVTVPIVDFNTATATTATTATIGATIVSDGGDDITAYGMCYGTTANPTNCVEVEQGALTAQSTPTVPANGSTSSVISSDGKNLYAIGGNSTVYMYARDTSTGALSALTPANITTGNYVAHDIAISPDGKFVYAGARQLNNTSHIAMFSRNSSTGLLTALSPSTYSAGSDAVNDMKISPDGRFLYVSLDNGYFYRYTRDISTGLITAQSGDMVVGYNGRGFAISPDGLFLYHTDSPNGFIRMYSIDQNTGNIAVLGTPTISTGASAFPTDIVISPDGNHVYITNLSAAGLMFNRNSSTGVLTLMGAPNTIAAGTNSRGISISPDGKTVYVSSNNRIDQFFRNTSTGKLTGLTNQSFATFATYSTTISPDGKSVYSNNNTSNNIGMFNRSVGATVGATFTKAISGLTAGTTYYYRGYATNGVGTGYSTDSTFSTP